MKAIYVAIVFMLCGCYSAKKVSWQTDKALNSKHAPIVVKKVSDRYPCVNTVTKSDSSDYKKWMDSIRLLSEFYESLINEIQLDTFVKHDTIPCSDSVKHYQTNDAKYVNIIAAYKKQNAELLSKVNNVQPIHDTLYKEDERKIFIIQDKLDKAEVKVEKTQSVSDRWKIVAIIAGIIAIISILINIIQSKKPRL